MLCHGSRFISVPDCVTFVDEFLGGGPSVSNPSPRLLFFLLFSFAYTSGDSKGEEKKKKKIINGEKGKVGHCDLFQVFFGDSPLVSSLVVVVVGGGVEVAFGTGCTSGSWFSCFALE